MTQIPFNVSARAAILIGRENIANSKGAIIELVKNSHDADSKFCIVYIDNALTAIQQTLSLNQQLRILQAGINPLYFKKIYSQVGDKFYLNENARQSFKRAYEKRLRQQWAWRKRIIY